VFELIIVKIHVVIAGNPFYIRFVRSFNQQRSL